MSIIEKVIRKYKEKGLSGILFAVFMRFSFVRMVKHRRIMSYLKQHYDYVIQRYKDYAPPPVRQMTYLNIKA